jgi:hypothetical protein
MRRKRQPGTRNRADTLNEAGEFEEYVGLTHLGSSATGIAAACAPES